MPRRERTKRRAKLIKRAVDRDGAVDVDVGVNVDEDEDSRCLKILEYFHAWMRTAVPTA